MIRKFSGLWRAVARTSWPFDTEYWNIPMGLRDDSNILGLERLDIPSGLPLRKYWWDCLHAGVVSRPTLRRGGRIQMQIPFMNMICCKCACATRINTCNAASLPDSKCAHWKIDIFDMYVACIFLCRPPPSTAMDSTSMCLLSGRDAALHVLGPENAPIERLTDLICFWHMFFLAFANPHPPPRIPQQCVCCPTGMQHCTFRCALCEDIQMYRANKWYLHFNCCAFESAQRTQ